MTNPTPKQIDAMEAGAKLDRLVVDALEIVRHRSWSSNPMYVGELLRCVATRWPTYVVRIARNPITAATIVVIGCDSHDIGDAIAPNLPLALCRAVAKAGKVKG